MNLAEALARIERWTALHAPATLTSLRPPAAAAALDRIQDTIGVTLLPELVDLHQWHDGSSGPARPFWIAPDFGFLPLQGMLDDWQMSNDVFGIDPHTGGALWHPGWLPIGTTWTGDLLVVDHTHQRTARTVFPIEKGNGPRPDKAWPNIPALMRELLHAMEAGQPIRRRHLHTRNGELEWTG